MPKALPEKLVPAVKVLPFSKLIDEASVPCSLCAAPENVIFPDMLAVVPVFKFIANALEPLMLSCEPASIIKSVPVPPVIVKELGKEDCKFTVVFPVAISLPIV